MTNAQVAIFFVLASAVTPARADLTYVKSAEYTCRVEAPSKYFSPSSVFRLKFETLAAGKGTQLRIEDERARSLHAIQTPSDTAFLIKDENLYRKTANRGYLMFDPMDGGGQKVQLSIASKVGPGSYEGDRMNCELIGRRELGTVKVQNFDCATTAPLKSTGKVQTVKFALAGTDDPTQLAATKAFRMSPKNSVMDSLNANLSLQPRRDAIRIFGDSAGIDFTEILLYRASGFSKGSLTNQSDGKTIDQADLACKVK